MIESATKHNTFLMNPKFGIKGYNVQDSSQWPPNYKIANHPNCISKKKNRDNFIDDYLKLTKWQPSAKYDMISNWTKNFEKKGKFSKEPKVTHTQSIMNENKKRPKPAPSDYKITGQIEQNLKHLNKNRSNSDKYCGFIEEAKFHSL